MPDDDRPHSTLGLGTKPGLRAIADNLLTEHAYISLAELARNMGCSYWTVYTWYRTDPTFKQAFDISKQNKVDLVKESAVQRAIGSEGQKPSDLMTMFILNNYDQEIVERTAKNAGTSITIHLEVPTRPIAVESWATEVAKALPDAAIEAKYKELVEGSP